MVPKGWTRQVVGNLFEVQLGKMLNKAAKEKAHQVAYLTNFNVRWGTFDISKLNSMYFTDKDKAKFALQEGDLLVCEGGEVGRCAIWKGEINPCYYQKALHRLRPKGQIISEYFQSYMEHIAGTKYLDDFTSRTSIAHLTKEKFIELTIPLPPLLEQTEIVKVLFIWDCAIATTKQLLSNSRHQKNALMQQLLTGKKRFLGAEGEFKRYHFSDLLKVDAKSLGKKTPEGFEFDYISLSDVAIGRIASQLERHKFLNAPSRARRVVSEGDILLATVRPNLQAFAQINKKHSACIASTGFSVLTPNKNVCGDYIYHYLFSAHITGQINALVVGTNYPAINSSEVGGLAIYCPDYEEQKKIAEVLNVCDSTISGLQNNLEKLRQEKNTLMQQLLTGKRRVKI